MKLTVGKLKKALKGIPDNTPVYIADHDHPSYGTNSVASEAHIFDQSQMSDIEKKMLERDSEYKIKGKYFVIRP